MCSMDLNTGWYGAYRLTDVCQSAKDQYQTIHMDLDTGDNAKNYITTIHEFKFQRIKYS